MFNQNIQRVGFACKIQKALGTPEPSVATKSTTITALDKLDKTKAYEKLYSIVENNLAALKNQIKWVSTKQPELRMFRITSDLFPAYTHEKYTWVYFDSDIRVMLEKQLSQIGALARDQDIKLSFHPGQFCVLASDRPDVVENSIYEYEHHCDIIRYMGFGQKFQDFKCNVHIGGKAGPEGIKAALKKLSKEAQNTLTIENAEFSWGLDASLQLEKDCALVLDIHHHWIMSGEYIEPTDPRVQRVIESWRGVRPTIHYSLSREEYLPDHSTKIKPSLENLLKSGLTKAKLRAHSDMYWNTASNQWALSFLPYADIMCESKEKNIASFDLFKQKLA